jgi:pentatricopeptide repeat protein
VLGKFVELWEKMRVSGGKGKKTANNEEEEMVENKFLFLFSKIGALAEAVKWVERMREKEMKINLSSLTQLIYAHARQKDVDGAKKWLQEMRNEVVKPDTEAIYNGLVVECVLQKDMEGVQVWLEEMKKNNVAPNVDVCRTLVSKYAKVGDNENACKWLDVMKELKIQPDAVTYSSLIHMCTKLQKIEEAKGWIKEMENAGFTTNLIKLNALIGACARIGDLKEAKQFLEEIKKRGLKPNVLTYNPIMILVAKKRTDVQYWIDDMVENGVKPDVITFYALLSGAIKRKKTDVELVVHWLREMKEEEIKPDKQVLDLLATLATEQGMTILRELLVGGLTDLDPLIDAIEKYVPSQNKK